MFIAVSLFEATGNQFEIRCRWLGNYRIILPIMVAAGLSSIIAEFIDPESIYFKKLKRRGDSITRGHELHYLEHVMVRDVMMKNFPTLRMTGNLTEIIRVARADSHIESLPVMDENNQLAGIIYAEDLHRALDSDLNAMQIRSFHVWNLTEKYWYIFVPLIAVICFGIAALIPRRNRPGSSFPNDD